MDLHARLEQTLSRACCTGADLYIQYDRGIPVQRAKFGRKFNVPNSMDMIRSLTSPDLECVRRACGA